MLYPSQTLDDANIFSHILNPIHILYIFTPIFWLEKI